MGAIAKPPKGIKPDFLVWEERLDEIDEAIKRFVNVKKEIPSEWIDERNMILQYLKYREQKKK
jgi:hypothetical protein